MFKICLFIFFAIVHFGATKSLQKREINDTDKNYEENVKYLGFVTSGDYYSCLCLIISKRHLLASASCVMRHENNLKIMVGAIPYTGAYWNNEGIEFDVKDVKYDDGHLEKLQRKNINLHNNFAVLTLSRDLPVGEKVKIAKLPSEDIKIDETANIYGWYQTCSIRSPARIISVPLNVVNPSDCNNIQSDEFCARISSKKIIRSSPVIKNGTIIGYTAFECPENNNNPVTNVYKSLSFINSVMNN